MEDASTGLFSLAAINARRQSNLGTIVLVRQPAFFNIAVAAAILSILIVALFYFGSYTKRNTVKGEVTPVDGLVKIYPSQQGRILSAYVEEGENVTRGQTLFIVSSGLESATQGDTQKIISEQISNRIVSLTLDKQKVEQLLDREGASLRDELNALIGESEKLGGLIEVQKSRLDLARNNAKRYQGLFEKDYTSREDWELRLVELLEQKAKMSSLALELSANRKVINKKQHEIETLPLIHQTRLADIDKQVFSANEELARSELQREMRIVSPIDGTATALSAHSGQLVAASKPILSIVPAIARMQVNLYAPSNTAGFVKAGDLVLLRYQAYPYQKFGKHRGRVKSVARTALPADELTTIPDSVVSQASHDQPLYKVTVELESQTIAAYGSNHDLASGTLVEAEIEQESRKLYEWVLEPLFAISGKL